MAKLIREEDDTFSGGGIKLKPIEPMRTWKVEFSGTLKNTKTLEENEVVPHRANCRAHIPFGLSIMAKLNLPYARHYRPLLIINRS